MTTQHTPFKHRQRPDDGYSPKWEVYGYDGQGYEIQVAVTLREANAAFIVRACNAHDDLIAAADEAIAALLGAVGVVGDIANLSHARQLLEAAKAKAEGK